MSVLKFLFFPLLWVGVLVLSACSGCSWHKPSASDSLLGLWRIQGVGNTASSYSFQKEGKGCLSFYQGSSVSDSLPFRYAFEPASRLVKISFLSNQEDVWFHIGHLSSSLLVWSAVHCLQRSGAEPASRSLEGYWVSRPGNLTFSFTGGHSLQMLYSSSSQMTVDCAYNYVDSLSQLVIVPVGQSSYAVLYQVAFQDANHLTLSSEPDSLSAVR